MLVDELQRDANGHDVGLRSLFRQQCWPMAPAPRLTFHVAIEAAIDAVERPGSGDESARQMTLDGAGPRAGRRGATALPAASRRAITNLALPENPVCVMS